MAEEIKAVNTEPEQFFTVLGVMFDITKKRYYFEVTDKNETYKKGDRVIVDTIRGQEIGVVYNTPITLSEKYLVLPLKPVIKKASEEEVAKYELLRKEAEEAQKICREKVAKHNLPMKLVNTEYTFDKTKLIFYFTAEGRIDFRELVKDLANIFKLRIELRQIGVRDEARILFQGAQGIQPSIFLLLTASALPYLSLQRFDFEILTFDSFVHFSDDLSCLFIFKSET